MNTGSAWVGPCRGSSAPSVGRLVGLACRTRVETITVSSMEHIVYLYAICYLYEYRTSLM